MAALTQLMLENADETFALGRRLAGVVDDMTTVSLQGQLGAGKTLFARGYARGLGISESVTSPTFAIVQEYPRPDGGWLYHLDMYRIADENAALAFGIDDYLFPENGVSLIEWPERIAGLLVNAPPGGMHLTIGFEHCGENRRKVTLPTTLVDRLGVVP